ncbi:MAG: hypothetical protein CMK32_09585 [Porticoccaceae bacterium]|nr:hypothetical protein [Porticoccaceae bacterium]
MRLFKLGQNIREYRERTLSLGLREAAEKWGTTPSKLTAIESGLAESEWRPPGFPKHLEIQPPVKEGWVVNGCDDRRLLHDDEQFRKRALEALYIAIDPGGGRMMSQLERNEMFRLIGLVDELSFSLVGGVPTAHERFT